MRCERWLLLLTLGLAVPAAAGSRTPLVDGWTLQSSAKVSARGEDVSRPGFATAGWHAVTVPNTVVGALVESGTYRDPYFGMNLRSIPGTSYPIGQRFTLLPTPDDSPFKPSWWYRREVALPRQLAGRSLTLHLDGVNYRASVWFNGTRIGTPDEVVGVFRRFQFDVTALARPGETNVIAVEVTGPEPHDLAIMWVDWNPTPADKNMGLWGDVYLTDSGPLALRHPHVVTRLDLPSLATARLTVTAEVKNASDRAVSGVVRGDLEGARFSQPVSLGPGESRLVRFTPAAESALTLKNPRVWWPYRMGSPELYTMDLEVETDGAVSDRRQVRFGVHEMTSELTDKGHRLFK